MKVASVNVGLPREVIWRGRAVTTGIYKEPVEGRVALRKLNLDGDRQADLSVHGGEFGDRFSVGSAEVVVTQPRLPCYKLGVRFQSDDMVRRFLASGRTGFYLAVSREGEVGAGDEIKVISRDENAVPVSEITRLYIAKRYDDGDVKSLRRALRVGALPDGWKQYFGERLERARA